MTKKEDRLAACRSPQNDGDTWYTPPGALLARDEGDARVSGCYGVGLKTFRPRRYRMVRKVIWKTVQINLGGRLATKRA